LKQRSVLALLALEANRVVSTDRLLDQIWPDAAGPGARHRLEVGVSNLRKILGAGARIESRAGGYVLNLEEDELDLHRYTRLVNAARAARAHGDIKLAAARLREALDLWRGPPLADLTYESFASADIERLSEERLGVLEERVDSDLDLGRHAQVVPELADLVAEHALREGLRRQLMVALFRCGRQAEALTAYASGRELLLDRLGIEPSPMLKDLERAILDHDPALDAPAFVADLGGVVDFQSLRPVGRPAAGNLPAQLTSFVGRERELAEIRGLLGSARLVTLTGPGGSGKTRLALQVANEQLRNFDDGVWLADLSPLADAALVAATVAGGLGVREDAARPMIEILVDAVRDRHMLVVIDNCEHVIEAAAQIADALLRSSPGVTLLTTSREPLRVSGERAYRVPSLHVPDADEDDPSLLAASDAVRLFAERAAQHRVGYALDSSNAPTIARICR
jgi:DNA-binding SARP family transcriptional activator